MALTKVTTGGITDATIATADIADDAVTNAKIAAGAVGGTQLGNNAVTADKIGANEVTSAAIAAGAVGTAKLSDQCVTLDKLPHGTGSTDGKFLRANNGGDPTFETVSIPAGTTINNNADNKIITGSGTANTLEAESLAQIASDGDLWIGHAPTTHYDNRKAFFHQPTADETCYISITGPQGAGIVFGDSPGQNTGNYESIIWHRNSDDRLMITTDNGNKGLYLENGGDIEVIDGNVKFASGHGIDFSATGGPTNGTGSSELLDDYEEGTWTATCSNSVTLHSSQDLCMYTKIGRQVTVRGQIRVNDENGGNQNLIINNLPFANLSGGDGASSTAGAVRLWDQNVPSDTLNVVCEVSSNDSYLNFWVNRDNTGAERMKANTNAYALFTITYFTS